MQEVHHQEQRPRSECTVYAPLLSGASISLPTNGALEPLPILGDIFKVQYCNLL